MSEFSQQFTIPYATNIEILTGADFTIDSREKIYLKDDKSTNRYVILFYKEKEADPQKLRPIQKIFIDTGSQKFQDVSFKVCSFIGLYFSMQQKERGTVPIRSRK